MRTFLCAMVLVASLSAQQGTPVLTPAAQAEASAWEPGSNSFFVNGIAYRFVARPTYAVVAAATANVAGKYLGLKVHIYNRSRQTVTVKPEDMELVDAIGNRRLAPVPAQEIAERKRGQPAWLRVTGNAISGQPSPPVDGLNPQWSDLVRALQPQVNASADPEEKDNRVFARQNLQSDGPDCDTTCQLRNREVNSMLSTGWQPQNLADSIEHTAFLANTIPPRCDVEGVLYFPMPKLASTDPAHRRQSKSYAVTLTVTISGERLQLDFPVE